MRNQIFLLAGLMMTGCAAQPAAMPAVTIPPEGGAAALAFDAPITLDEAPINLSRATRGPAAFAGYDNNSTSYYDIISYNRQTTDFSDRFVRQSITERVGTTQR